MRFSQRIGKKPVKTVLQIDGIDEDLTNRLWNIVLDYFFKKFDDFSLGNKESSLGLLCLYLWKEFFNSPQDTLSKYSDGTIQTEVAISNVRQWFYKAEWFDIYDFIEFAANVNFQGVDVFIDVCNLAFQREVAGYRFVDKKIVQITSEEEIKEIEEATNSTNKWASVNKHLQTALDMLADRKSPDYRNSIKESISAVEALCIIITGDSTATLGKALAIIERKHSLHGSLKTAFSAIYGYTSDEGGIRHSLMEDGTSIEFEDAKFILVACSAFINYLKAKMKI